MYAYIKGNEENRNGKSEVFFWTYNPQGKNDFEEINHYEFENINEENKKGLKNKIIILNFFRFFKSFRKMRYQNRNLVNINYNINKFISNLDLLSNLSIYKKKNIIEKYKENTDYFFCLLSLLQLYKENKEIYKNLISELFDNYYNK